MSDVATSKNDKAWEALFTKYDILHAIDVANQFVISADQIREFREPRLMTKFDHTVNLPQLFAKNKLSILPVSRGDYMIAPFHAYKKFEDKDTAVSNFSLPAHLQSLDANNIPSEAIAINCALASGILSDFLDEECLYSTVSGRMGSDRFDFDIENLRTDAIMPVHVINSQIEIDAALEGVRSLAILEAKRDLSEDFLIRQLYYPFRVWSNRISKCVRPVFLVYSNGIFNLYEYQFSNKLLYNSLELIQQRNYSIESIEIELSDLKNVLHQVVPVEEPRIAFPQADKFERIINLCELLQMRELSRDEITEEYAFDVRQTDYYSSAARYLNLVDKKYKSGVSVYGLSNTGRKVMALSYKKRQLAFCNQILQHKVFFDTFIACLKAGKMPDLSSIIKIMKSDGLYKVSSESTYDRRASTINSWLNWILGLL